MDKTQELQEKLIGFLMKEIEEKNKIIANLLERNKTLSELLKDGQKNVTQASGEPEVKKSLPTSKYHAKKKSEPSKIVLTFYQTPE